MGKSTVTMTFEECKLVTPTNCKLTRWTKKTIETTELKGELELTGSGKRIEDKFEPKEGTPLPRSVSKAKNPRASLLTLRKKRDFAVTGSQLCEVDTSNTEAETEATTHKMKCKSRAALKSARNPAEMTSEATVKLTSGKKWSVKET